MAKRSRQSFNDFLTELIHQKKISLEQVKELSGVKELNRILDNAGNEMGIPVLSNNFPVLEGQTHEIAGSIPDAKARLAMNMELLEQQNKDKQTELENERNTPQP